MSEGIPQFAMLDVWLALGGEPREFDAWINERTPADAWAQLLGVIRCDLMVGDTNPPPGEALVLVWKRIFGELKATAAAIFGEET